MNILITGASTGIGVNLALQLAQEGGHSILIVARSVNRLKDIQDKISALNNGSRCTIFPGDLSDQKEVMRISSIIKQQVDHIDILVNNAGYLINKPFSDTSDEEIKQMLHVNFLAPACLIRELIMLLKNASDAHVINIGSMGGVQGSLKFPGLSFYSSSKGALAILTECLAEEYKHTNMKFNCLALGSADTEMLRQAFPGYKAAVSAADMAKFIMNFAFTGHKFFNGKVISVALTTP